MLRRVLAPFVALLVLALATPAQQVLVVDAQGAGDFTALQPAVDAAADGDVLLLRAGTYAGAVISGKGLALVAADADAVLIEGQLRVEGVPLGSTLLLSGLALDGGVGTGEPTFLADTNPGVLWLQSCDLAGTDASGTLNEFAQTAARLLDCADVVLVRCTLVGGTASSFPHHQGADGLRADQSDIWSFESFFTGTAGGFDDDVGGLGGDGADLTGGSRLFAAFGEFRGAQGGGADDDFDQGCGCIICGAPGSGGSGVFLFQSEFIGHDVRLIAGQGGGSTSAAGCSDGPAGALIGKFGNSPSELLPGTPRGLRVSPLIGDGSAFDMVLFGEPGEIPWLLASLAPRVNWMPARAAPLLPGPPILLIKPLAPVPASGVLELHPVMPALPAGLEGLRLVSQAWFSGANQLANGSLSVVVDADLL